MSFAATVSETRARATTELSYLVFGHAHRRRSFTVSGRRYRYHAHRYNATWTNERTVELPIVISTMREHAGARVLEVGNVLAHYGIRGHEIVDKYEDAPGVVNADILAFTPDTDYQLIVSISTLEHIGFEEELRDPGKPARVLEHLTGLLAPEGMLLVTFPLGYNPALDAQVRAGSLPLGQTQYLRRISRDNRWKEVALSDLNDPRYGTPYPKANALAVARAHVSDSPR